MAAWLCMGALGFAQQVHAEDATWARWSAERLARSCEENEAGVAHTLGNAERRQVVDDIFEYTYRVRVGPGSHDSIILHRVVRELWPWSPVRTQKSMFLVHGDVLGFQGAFLSSAASSAVPRNQSIAVFLARRGVDVWGIDLRWVHVPSGTTDFSFMKDWNLGLHARDVGIGLELARGWRSFTGNGNGQMVLLGWSRGASVAYAYLNAETQAPQNKRHVSGFIPVDMAYSFAPGATPEREAACLSHAVLAQEQSEGKYEGGEIGMRLQALGASAVTHPTESSVLLPGSTNRQAALFFGSATYVFQEPLPVIQGYHWAAGLSEEGALTGLAWTDERFFYDTLVQAAPYQSIGEQVDTFAMWCGAPDVPYDDHLARVKVPVLYVGASGGVGGYGLHGLSRLGSTDVSTHMVPDYGHADLFLASGAENAVWAPILDWVQRH
ncbi:hypothetical protein KYC5002_43970 [Archangium violaceum]|uniref:hypothetical protein n=1 Tax=Archangium violaceum TaxID=83451 RepID=UPI002B2BEF93|nr:hypothetical protein KYC5002_43970 [Archangium gephyra]